MDTSLLLAELARRDTSAAPATFVAAGADGTASVEWLASTGATVRRTLWDGTVYDEELVVSGIDFSRVAQGALPFLLDHVPSVGAQIGVGVSARIAPVPGGGGLGLYIGTRLSTQPELAGLVGDIEAGVLRTVSIGYKPTATEVVERDGMPPLVRVTACHLLELSLVSIPADPGAVVRSETITERACDAVNPTRDDDTDGAMSATDPDSDSDTDACPICGGADCDCDPTDSAPDTDADTDDSEATRSTQPPAASTAGAVAGDSGAAARFAPANLTQTRSYTMDEIQAARVAERTRITEIRSLGTTLSLDAAFVESHIAGDTSLEAFRSSALTAIAARQAASPTRPNVQVITDETDTLRELAAEALLHRSAGQPNAALSDGAKQFRGLTIPELARDLVERRGVRTRGMASAQVIEIALGRDGGYQGPSDLPAITLNVANKSLRRGFQSAPKTFERFVRNRDVPDFRQITSVALGDASALGETTEQGELTYGSIGDSKEVYALRTFGKIYRFGRRLFLADDLGALTTLPEKIGRAAAEIESNLFWLQIIEANPNMGDGLPLFCAQHNNVITGVQPINVANMALVEEMLAEQVSDQGVVLNLQLDAVAVHTSNRLALQQLFGPIVATQEGNVNPYAGGAGLGYCYEPRLKLKSNWYAFASTGQIDLVERAYLNGQAGLYTETRMGFEVDGIEIKCRLDVAMKALEWRGMIKVGI